MEIALAGDSTRSRLVFVPVLVLAALDFRSTVEREQLAAIAADRDRPRKHVERARIVLASAAWHSAQQVAQRVGVSRPTVWRWQQRFAEGGVEDLLRDKTRKPGKAPLAMARRSCSVQVLVHWALLGLETEPNGFTRPRWSRQRRPSATLLSGSPDQPEPEKHR